MTKQFTLKPYDPAKYNKSLPVGVYKIDEVYGDSDLIFRYIGDDDHGFHIITSLTDPLYLELAYLPSDAERDADDQLQIKAAEQDDDNTYAPV